jgi:hypothetical protein
LGETLFGVVLEALGYVLVEVLFHGLRRLGAKLRSWAVPGLSFAQALKRPWNFLLGLIAVLLFVALLFLIT